MHFHGPANQSLDMCCVRVLLGFELINDTMIRIQGFQQGIGEEQRARKDMRSRGQGSREKGIEERAVRRDPTRMVFSLRYD